MFGFGSKAKKGTDSIDEVVIQFANMIDKLNSGVNDCKDECGSIAEQKKHLNTREDYLKSRILQASGMVAKLGDIVSK